MKKKPKFTTMWVVTYVCNESGRKIQRAFENVDEAAQLVKEKREAGIVVNFVQIKDPKGGLFTRMGIKYEEVQEEK